MNLPRDVVSNLVMSFLPPGAWKNELFCLYGQLGQIYAWKEIKNKKEELFTLMANMERQYDTRLTKAGFQNTRMLQQLAVQIEPRPADPLWYYTTTSSNI
jgi:hypothetical protein